MELKLTKFILQSEMLNRVQSYYLLEKKDQGQDVDLLFVQDGDDYLQLGQLQDAFRKLKDENRGALILIPPGTSLERYHFYHPNGNSHQAYLSFFYEELIPQVEKIFSEKRKRIHKIGLLGDSLAGAVNLAIAAKKPKRWTHLLLQSAAFSNESYEQVKQVSNNWKVYQMVGQKEDEFVSPITGEALMILTRNRLMKETLENFGATITYFEQPTDHLWDVWRQDLPRALSYFFQN
ncbi:MAG: alpha/beta hydrolase [Anaerobacillus sp.]|uniref:alpha/beta hydrolase n=1 Tax=Anaerobacillus sp. TaxID=1872506 RepID=UPI00391884E8